MWNVNPTYMCNVHLISEHREMHMIAGAIRAHVRINGHVLQGLLEPEHVGVRHDLLVAEMVIRGFRHRSPLFEYELSPDLPPSYVCEVVSWAELQRRCQRCREKTIFSDYQFLRAPHACGTACADRVSRDIRARPSVEQGIAPEIVPPKRRRLMSKKP